MKRVSFKVATAIKKSGYPQEDLSVWYDDYGVIFTIRPKEGTEYYVAPTYLEVWLWLWREKKLFIQPELCFRQNNESAFVSIEKINNVALIKYSLDDPEEVIIASIEYLCDNDLIK